MHLEVLAGRVGLDEARRERFRRVFLAFGIALDEANVDAVASAYRSGYMSARRALDGAPELLAALPRTPHRHRHQQPARRAAGQARVLRARCARRRADRVGGRRRLEAGPGIFDIALDRLGVDAPTTP